MRTLSGVSRSKNTRHLPMRNRYKPWRSVSGLKRSSRIRSWQDARILPPSLLGRRAARYRQNDAVKLLVQRRWHDGPRRKPELRGRMVNTDMLTFIQFLEELSKDYVTLSLAEVRRMRDRFGDKVLQMG